MRASHLTIVALSLLCLLGCRFREEFSWMEAHGEAQMQRIAGGEDGIFAVGGAVLYRYPGPSVPPWTRMQAPTTSDVAACANKVVVLGTDGVVSRLHGVPTSQTSPIAGSKNWKATRVTTNCQGVIYVLSNAFAHRLVGRKLVALPCKQVATELTVDRQELYLLTPEGKLVRGDTPECTEVNTPGAVASVAAARDRLAVVTTLGRVHLRHRGNWRSLPSPTLHRGGRAPLRETFTQVALSGDALIALSTNGGVFMTSPPL